MNIALFTTCLIDQFLPEVAQATARLLQRLGHQPWFPREQTCCGQPFFNSGLRAQAVALAQHTIATLEATDAVVVPGGSCTAMIRVAYPHLFADDPGWGDRARALAERTFELSEFLTQVIDWHPPHNSDAPAVTYHDSCHMKRMLGLDDGPRKLLQAAGCRLIEMQEPDRCCGFGGVFSMLMPETSDGISAEKWRQARATGAEVLVTADPGCLLHLRARRNGGPQAVHLAVLLEELTR